MTTATFPESWDRYVQRERERSSEDEDPAPDPFELDREVAFERFVALFGGELDEVRALAAEYDAALEDVACAWAVVRNGTRPMTSHSALQDELDLSGPQTWATASVLVEFGELHRAKDGQWWWVHCSGYLAELCRERELSLKRYIEMRPVLQDCQDAMIEWYETRHMHGNLQPRTMGEIKLAFCRRLQRECWGIGDDEELVGPETWSDHRVSRYVRTAQDVIVEAYNLTY